MAWTYPITDVQRACLQGEKAAKAGRWHIATQQYLYCLERSDHANDEHAFRFFAHKLATSYKVMDMPLKAGLFILLSQL